MKKATLCTILVLCFIMLAGCKREEIVITAEDVQTNTLLVNNKGTVQAAIVEKFDKKYYSLSELKDFISKKINEYNSEAGVGTVAETKAETKVGPITLNSLDIKDGNAILILNYATIDDYAAFNKVEATLATMESAQNGEISTPDVFISASDGALISKEIVLKNSKYKVLIVNENTDVIVDGTIKYYTNAVLVSSSKVQTDAEGETVIIYKP